MDTSRSAPIRPRRSPLSAEAAIPRRWFAGSAAATGLANGVNLLFPHGERFFVRSVHRYVDRLDPALREQVRGFSGQEGRHAGAHERFFEIMRTQGYEVDRFLDVFIRTVAWLEARVPGALNLSVTVAVEHFTAILAEAALRDGILEGAHPAVRDLLLWHAAEEIEHKSVAFDVLAEVSPGYLLRMAGLAVASAILFGFWTAATAHLWRQDGLSPIAAARELAALRSSRAAATRRDAKLIIGRVALTLLRGLGDYLRPGFHPDDNDNAALARDYLASAGLEASASPAMAPRLERRIMA